VRVVQGGHVRGGSCTLCFFLSFLVGSRDWWWKGRGGSGFWFWGCCDMRWEEGFFGGLPETILVFV